MAVKSLGLGPQLSPRYARARTACVHFQIGRSTLWQWCHRPGFPQPVRAGQKVTLFDLNAIDAFLKAYAASVASKQAATAITDVLQGPSVGGNGKTRA